MKCIINFFRRKNKIKRQRIKPVLFNVRYGKINQKLQK